MQTLFTFYELDLSILCVRIMNSGNVQRKVHNNLIAAKRFKVRRTSVAVFLKSVAFSSSAHQPSDISNGGVSAAVTTSALPLKTFARDLISINIRSEPGGQNLLTNFHFLFRGSFPSQNPARTENCLLSSRVEFLQELFGFNKIKKEMIHPVQEPQIETKLILKVYGQLLESDPKLANSSLDIKVTTKMNLENPAKLQAIKIICKMTKMKGKFPLTTLLDMAQKVLGK